MQFPFLFTYINANVFGISVYEIDVVSFLCKTGHILLDVHCIDCSEDLCGSMHIVSVGTESH